VPKGKPWSIEEESALKQLVTAGHPLETIAEKLGKPDEAVRQKIRRLGLEVVDQNRSVWSTTSKLILPKELPSIEEALKLLADASKRARVSRLNIYLRFEVGHISQVAVSRGLTVPTESERILSTRIRNYLVRPRMRAGALCSCAYVTLLFRFFPE